MDGCEWCLLDQRCHSTYLGSSPCSESGDIIGNVSLCPAVAPNKTGFDLSLARQMMWYANAAYFDEPQDYVPDTLQVVRKFSFTLGLWDSAFMFIALDESAKQIVMAFRGSETVTQLTEELLHHALVSMPGHNEEVLVNEFFLTAVEVLMPFINSALEDLQKLCHDCRLLATGHSLGGSLATLSAYNVSFKSHTPVIYSFGQPRVGNAALARSIDSRLPEVYRVVNAADPVPHIPLCGADGAAPAFRSNSCDNASRSDYYHAGTEIWFPSGDYERGIMCHFRECLGEPRHEDWSCSDGAMSLFDSDVLDHHAYWKAMQHGFCGDAEVVHNMLAPEIVV
eukprot:TRINITY_DN9726_c0_g2_i1.p1 TRINITY_DN9726_c0_g2~~TRINITY_DN9726_c0_g2_i1.p1  ORF type:complete len:385 (+),score=54.54 TRINITY_DN9726_c0_g2_i1:144-1157(+)